jgi:BlaI family transcriptional regulator, penicillinase repressor
MTRSRPHRLGDLQLRLLKVLWEQPNASVAEVHQALGPKAGLAYTTVATMLRKMEARGLVAHDTEGRRFLYRAAVTPNAVTRGMADDLLERLFEGRLADLVSHLLSTREVTQEELVELERLIAERKQQP